MKQTLIAIAQYLAATLLVALCLSFYGCSDSASVSEDVAVPLSSLTVTPGSLRPAFFSNTTNYTVNAPTSATSVTVTATPKDSTVTMMINGEITVAGQGRSVPLGPPGSITPITILLEATNGTDSTYTVNVTRLLSSNNNLSALEVTPGTLNPAFAEDTEDYTVNVGVLVDSVTVSATKSDPTAMMLIGQTPVPPGTASGQATIPLGGPGTTTPATIRVTAPNNTSKTYTVKVVRALSSDNNLSALTVTPGSLNPAFASDQLTYTVDVATEVTSVDVAATKSDPNAVLSGSIPDPGTGVATGQATILLSGPGAPTTVTVNVTAPNGSPETYTITVNRAASNDKKLSALSLSAITGPLNLIPSFDPNHLDYTVEVPLGVIAVTVTATKSDPNAVLSGSVPDPGTGVATGQATIVFILLAPPQVSITVTAPDGSFQTYRVTVNIVAEPPASP